MAYTSWASPGFRPDEVEEIIRQSRVNNPLKEITGLLVFNGAAFLQVVEGSESAISELERKLRADTRHCSLVVRDRRPVGKRAFPDWSMGLLQIASGRFEGSDKLQLALERDVPAPVRELLLAMRRSIPLDEPLGN